MNEIQYVLRDYNSENTYTDDPEFKGQLNSEWIYEVIISPKIPTKNYRDFCPGSKQGRPGQRSL